MKTLPFILLLSAVQPLTAQQKNYAADVASPEAIAGALYAVISGETGQDRDWDRFRNLFMPESRLIPTRKSENGAFGIRTLSPEDYIQLFSARISTGFFERELHRVVESYGTITHIFSTYETREKPDGTATNRGINSIQLFYDGKRYFIVNVFWCAESMGFPLPEKYLN